MFFLLAICWLLTLQGLKAETNMQSSIGGKSSSGQLSCANGSQVADECQCKEMETLCNLQPCLTRGESIQRRYMCDGIFDCADLSDECLCDRRTEENVGTYDICAQLFTDTLNMEECPLGYAACGRNYGGVEITKPGCVKSSEFCDGKVQCMDVSDEALCRNINESVSAYLEKKNLHFIQNVKQYFSCENRTHFIEKIVQDEEVVNHSSGYYNGKWLWIDWRRRFDGISDCEDISDEWHPNFVYCDDNGTDLVITRCPETPEGDRIFATPVNLADSYMFPVIEWFLGISGLVGNTMVALYSLRAIFRRKEHSDDGDNSSSNATLHVHDGKTSNHILVLFLCTSDLLMAIQIIMMAAANEHFRGKYWEYDESWQSSLTCAISGSLAVFSTQASAFMIVAISFVRLYVISRPFRTLKTKYVVWISISTYAIAATLMFIPFMTFIAPFEKYFMNAAHVKNHPQVDATVLERDKIEDYVRKIVILHSPSEHQDYTQLKWAELEQIVHEINPNFANWIYFGYTSLLSICIPPIVARWTDPGLMYSFSILVVDFAMFSLVFIAYSTVYHKTSRRAAGSGCIMAVGCCSKARPIRSASVPNVDATMTSTTRQDRTKSLTRDEEDLEMQKRILWIIGTDFACWAPICILTLVSIINPDVKSEESIMAAMILVQINCVVNPLVYSRRIRSGLKHLVQKLYRVMYSLTLKLFKRGDSGTKDSAVINNESTLDRGGTLSSIVPRDRSTQTSNTELQKIDNSDAFTSDTISVNSHAL